MGKIGKNAKHEDIWRPVAAPVPPSYNKKPSCRRQTARSS